MNKSALRSTFKALLNRNDCSDTLADTFIDQAIGRVQRTLRIPCMERSADIAFTQALPNSFIIPDDFLDFIDIYYDGVDGGKKLKKLPRSAFLSVPKVGGRPTAYIRTGNAVEIRPYPASGQLLSLLYYATATDLVLDTDVNGLSEVCPELIIYGALSFAGDYFVDDRKGAYEDVYKRIYGELEEQAYSLEFSGSDMAVQSAYPGAEY